MGGDGSRAWAEKCEVVFVRVICYVMRFFGLGWIGLGRLGPICYGLI